jgi:hypothetical protein
VLLESSHMTISKSFGQIPLPFEFFREEDRNFEKGGRSFYFFDFDDNVVHLGTKIVLFHKFSNLEKAVSTQQFALVRNYIGQPNTEWTDWELRDEWFTGSFRNFRELPNSVPASDDQPLIQDMIEALSHPFSEWRGPSWEFFLHAVNNDRPIAIITARGAHPHTIRRAINLLRNSRDLRACPNFVSVYPVSHPETRLLLGDKDQTWSTAELKKAAIKKAVEDAFQCYGRNPHHRFGMSDDDPDNIELITHAMQDLKRENEENAFFVINTHERQLIKEEVLLKKEEARTTFAEQASLTF